MNDSFCFRNVKWFCIFVSAVIRLYILRVYFSYNSSCDTLNIQQNTNKDVVLGHHVISNNKHRFVFRNSQNFSVSFIWLFVIYKLPKGNDKIILYWLLSKTKKYWKLSNRQNNRVPAISLYSRDLDTYFHIEFLWYLLSA